MSGVSNGGRIPKDECQHVGAMVVTWYDRVPIYWCPACERHLSKRDYLKVAKRA